MQKGKRRLLLVIALLMTACLLFIGIKLQPAKEPVSPSVEEEVQNSEALVQHIASLAQEGKVPAVPFVVGQADKKAVYQQWGEPQQVSKATNGEYEDYSDHHVTIGYQGTRAFDIRSFKADLQTIHLAAIKNSMGEPDESRYYQDDTTDQIILVYQVNDTYQLKWILPKPTDANNDPVVHHISVYTTLEEDTVEQMSLDEKIGQMLFAGVSGTILQQETTNLMHQLKVGGLIFYANNLATPEQTVGLINAIKAENEANRFPLFIGTDQEGGNVTRLPGNVRNFPTNKKIGEINQPQFSYEIGQLLAEQLKAFGFNLDFAPVLDVNSNPNNPIIGDRAFASHPDIVSELGIQTMKGLASQQIIPVIKHFPGHGDTTVDSHLELPKVTKSLADLQQLELIPFKAAIEKGADVVMVAHILLPAIDAQYPSSMSREIITGILRNELGFDGVVMTDDMTMKAITNHFEIGQAAVDAIKAGNDIVLIAHEYANVEAAVGAIKAAVSNGELTEERIDESVRRIMQLKQKYKLSNNPAATVDLHKLNTATDRVLNTYMK
ncbi:beta-N-acetylhexosaminidase [Lysinibacillus sp. FSL H8-0500]|uniref:beta-N-acetylhexosaminidase n=1 Tax=Lysinibacillus sp. FSL H8-0500 TaxID=2921393 RepID=UPI00310151D9